MFLRNFGICFLRIFPSFFPAMVMLPSVGSSSFNNSLIRVDFPEPLSPTTNTNSPSSISRLTSFKAGTPAAYVLLTCSSVIIISPSISNSRCFHILHILDYHECDLKRDCIFKNPQIQTCAFLQLVQTIYQRISMNVQLS